MSTATPATVSDLLQGASPPRQDGDDGSRQLIERTWSERPEAVCAIVRRALDLEAELTAARREIARLEQSLPDAHPLAASALDGQASRPAGGGRRPLAGLTLEDIGARFFAHHAGKAWVALLLLAAITVLVQERLL